MNINDMGYIGEQLARQLIHKIADFKKGDELFQADWILKHKNKWYVIEVKYKKEKYKPPPFYGHGLNLRQVKARQQFQKDTGIRAILFVFDRSDRCLYWQYIDKLEEGQKYTTRNKVRIYHLNSFHKRQLSEDFKFNGENGE